MKTASESATAAATGRRVSIRSGDWMEVDAPAPRLLPRHLMLSGLGVWGASLGGALAPGALRAVVWPNSGQAPPFALVAARPIAATLLWAALVVWCISWASVAGYVVAAWTARHGRRSWTSPALLLVSLSSPLLFGVAVSSLLGLATRDAYHVNGDIPYLGAVVLQFVFCGIYCFMTGSLPHAGQERAESA